MTTTAEHSAKEPKKIRPQFEGDKIWIFCEKHKKQSSNCSSAQLECSINNHDGNFSLKAQNEVKKGKLSKRKRTPEDVPMEI